MVPFIKAPKLAVRREDEIILNIFMFYILLTLIALSWNSCRINWKWLKFKPVRTLVQSWNWILFSHIYKIHLSFHSSFSLALFDRGAKTWWHTIGSARPTWNRKKLESRNPDISPSECKNVCWLTQKTSGDCVMQHLNLILQRSRVSFRDNVNSSICKQIENLALFYNFSIAELKSYITFNNNCEFYYELNYFLMCLLNYEQSVST